MLELSLTLKTEAQFNMDKPKEITKEEFLKEFATGKVKCYVKKPRSWKRTHIWWETNARNKELWFINIADDVRVKGKGTKIENSVLIIHKDLQLWANIWEREGYKFYIDVQ